MNVLGGIYEVDFDPLDKFIIALFQRDSGLPPREMFPPYITDADAKWLRADGGARTVCFLARYPGTSAKEIYEYIKDVPEPEDEIPNPALTSRVARFRNRLSRLARTGIFQDAGGWGREKIYFVNPNLMSLFDLCHKRMERQLEQLNNQRNKKEQEIAVIRRDIAGIEQQRKKIEELLS